MLKQFSAAKKLSPVKIGPQNNGFWKFKELNIKYSHLDPKGTSFPRTTSFGVFCVKMRSGV